MKKIFILIGLFTLIFSYFALCQEVEIESVVTTADPDFEFFVIGAGKEDGVELGDGLVVHRSGEKIGEAYIVEVRPYVSAAEILNVREGDEVLEGDSILIVKSTGPKEETAQPSPVRITETTYEQYDQAVSPDIIREEDIIRLDVRNSQTEVFAYARLTLMEDGFTIVSSNRSTGTIMAIKPLPMSILKELWADAVAAIDHNLVLSLEIKDKGGLSELKASSFREHTQKGRQVKRAVTRDSGQYNDMMALVSKIKERSE